MVSESKKILFYVNESARTRQLNHIPLLFPFWGAVAKAKNPFLDAALKQYGFDARYYDITGDVARADFVLLPYDYWDLQSRAPALLQDLIARAHAARKLILIYTYGDIEKQIHVKDSHVLRTGQYRFCRQSNDIIIPAYTEDLLQNYNNDSLNIRFKTEKPSVAFAGWAEAPRGLLVKTFIKETPLQLKSLFDARYGAWRKGLRFRREAIKSLQRSRLVDTRFIIRRSFSGHVRTVSGDVQKVRRDFVNNLLDADYALCVKGDGNFSNRFYEALSLGRIPLFVDTDCILPLEDEIDYKKFCCFVDFRDIKNIAAILLNFHRQLDADEFIAMQKRARSAFETYLRTDVFTKHLMQTLRSIADKFYQ
jgi:hypothetical protein